MDIKVKGEFTPKEMLEIIEFLRRRDPLLPVAITYSYAACIPSTLVKSTRADYAKWHNMWKVRASDRSVPIFIDWKMTLDDETAILLKLKYRLLRDDT